MDYVQIAWRMIPDGMPRREVAWSLLRELLPPGATITNPCTRCGGPHGRVRIAGADAMASVAYAGDVAVVAVGDGTAFGAIGIDAEPVDDTRRDAAGMRGVLGPGAASIRSWTRVEAALKADGRGLRADPATVRVEESAEGWSATLPDGAAFTGWDADSPPELVVSVAVRRISAAAAVPSDPATP